jgi:hypothetical protein
VGTPTTLLSSVPKVSHIAHEDAFDVGSSSRTQARGELSLLRVVGRTGMPVVVTADRLAGQCLRGQSFLSLTVRALADYWRLASDLGLEDGPRMRWVSWSSSLSVVGVATVMVDWNTVPTMTLSRNCGSASAGRSPR